MHVTIVNIKHNYISANVNNNLRKQKNNFLIGAFIYALISTNLIFILEVSKILSESALNFVRGALWWTYTFLMIYGILTHPTYKTKPYVYIRNFFIILSFFFFFGGLWEFTRLFFPHNLKISNFVGSIGLIMLGVAFLYLIPAIFIFLSYRK